MGWKETRVQDERLELVEQFAAQERSRAEICRGFGVSRKGRRDSFLFTSWWMGRSSSSCSVQLELALGRGRPTRWSNLFSMSFESRRSCLRWRPGGRWGCEDLSGRRGFVTRHKMPGLTMRSMNGPESAGAAQSASPRLRTGLLVPSPLWGSGR